MTRTTQTKQNDPSNIRVASARESFSGVLLTGTQFEDGISIVEIIKRRIKTHESFADPLGDYAYAFARSEKFLNPMKAETILRDLFKEVYGETMNQMRERLAKNAEKVTDEQRQKAYHCACDISDIMENGIKITFHRACSSQGQLLAEEFDITEAQAKRIMADEFKAAEDCELYDWGKELDEQFYRPQIEAEKAEREKQSRSGPAKSRARTRSRQPA